MALGVMAILFALSIASEFLAWSMRSPRAIARRADIV